MFGLGMGEVLIIVVLALLLLGPDKLPGAAKQIGKGLRELRAMTDDVKAQLEAEVRSDEQKAPERKRGGPEVASSADASPATSGAGAPAALAEDDEETVWPGAHARVARDASPAGAGTAEPEPAGRAAEEPGRAGPRGAESAPGDPRALT